MVDSKFFKCCQRVFKLLRLWPHYPEANKTPAFIFGKLMVFIFTAVSMTIISLSDTIEEIKHGGPKIVFSKALYLFGLIAASQKLFKVSFNDDEIVDCMKRLEDISKRFKDTEDIEKCFRFNVKLFIMGILFITLCTIVFGVAPLATDVKRPFLFTPHVPALDLQATPIWQLFYMYEVVSLYIVAVTMTTLDMLFCGMMYVCSGILSSICREVRGFDNIMEDHQTLDKQMKETIEKLNDITQLITRISDTFSSSAMVHITYNCITIALTLYMSKTLPFGVPMFAMIMAFVYINLQLWIYCYFGQNLVNQREVLGRELYFTQWYDGSKNFKTMLLLTIFEMQNDRFVYAGKIIPLSLETFSMVIKRAYTFFTFLAEAR